MINNDMDTTIKKFEGDLKKTINTYLEICKIFAEYYSEGKKSVDKAVEVYREALEKWVKNSKEYGGENASASIKEFIGQANRGDISVVADTIQSAATKIAGMKRSSIGFKEIAVSKLENLKEQSSAVISEYNLKSSEIDKLTTECNNNEKILKSISNEIDTLKKERSKLTTECANKKKILKNISNKIDTLKKKKDISNKINTLKKKRSKLTTECANKKKILKNISNKIDTLKKEIFNFIAEYEKYKKGKYTDDMVEKAKISIVDNEKNIKKGAAQLKKFYEEKNKELLEMLKKRGIEITQEQQ